MRTFCRVVFGRGVEDIFWDYLVGEVRTFCRVVIGWVRIFLGGLRTCLELVW